MTIIQIPLSEKEAHAHMCAVFDLGVKFYTQEHNFNMLTMEVDTDSSAVIYHLSKAACIRIQMLEALKSKAFDQEMKF